MHLPPRYLAVVEKQHLSRPLQIMQWARCAPRRSGRSPRLENGTGMVPGLFITVATVTGVLGPPGERCGTELGNGCARTR